MMIATWRGISKPPLSSGNGCVSLFLDVTASFKPS
jgi:hypothetical protein